MKIKKIFYPIIAVILIMDMLTGTASAATYTRAADDLKDLGLFLGTDKGYELDREPTRTEAAVMLVRLLGKETESKEKNYEHPFTDVPEWADAYVGYLYENGLTKGIGDGKFGATDLCTVQMFCTFVLRALGYTEDAGDFTYDEAIDFAAELRIFRPEDSKANPSGAYLKYTVNIDIKQGINLAYNFYTLKKLNYVIQEGDILEYDVTISRNERGWGAVDGEITGMLNLRDSGLEDTDGNSIHTGEDLSYYAYGKWYHRSITIGVTEKENGDKYIAGQTLKQIQLAMHAWDAENHSQGVVLYDNIVVTNGGEVKLVIFKDESDFIESDLEFSHSQNTDQVMIECPVFTPEEERAFVRGFTRDDCVYIMHNALLTYVKNSKTILLDKLIEQNAVNAQAVGKFKEKNYSLVDEMLKLYKSSAIVNRTLPYSMDFEMNMFGKKSSGRMFVNGDDYAANVIISNDGDGETANISEYSKDGYIYINNNGLKTKQESLRYRGSITEMFPLFGFEYFNISIYEVESIEKTLSGESIIYKIIPARISDDFYYGDRKLIFSFNSDGELVSIYVDVNDYFNGELMVKTQINVALITGDDVKIDFPDFSDFSEVEKQLPDINQYQYKTSLTAPGMADYTWYQGMDALYYDIALAKAGVPQPPEIESVKLQDINYIYLPRKLMDDKVFLGIQVTANHMGIFFVEDNTDIRMIDPSRREYGLLYYHGQMAQTEWNIIKNSSRLSKLTDDIYYIITYTNSTRVPPVMYRYYWWQDDVFMWFYCYGEESYNIIKDDILDYINSVVKTPVKDLLPDIKID